MYFTLGLLLIGFLWKKWLGLLFGAWLGFFIDMHLQKILKQKRQIAKLKAQVKLQFTSIIELSLWLHQEVLKDDKKSLEETINCMELCLQKEAFYSDINDASLLLKKTNIKLPNVIKVLKSHGTFRSVDMHFLIDLFSRLLNCNAQTCDVKKHHQIYAQIKGLDLSIEDWERFVDFNVNYSNKTNEEQNLQDAYRVLGVSVNATYEETRIAYKRLAKKFHPDKLAARGITDSKAIKEANDRLQKIQNAWDLMKKAKKWR